MPRNTNDGTTTTTTIKSSKGNGGSHPTVEKKEPPRLSTYLSGGSSNHHRKKSSTVTPVMDTTSVTSTSSHQPDVISVFQKKPNLVEPPPTIPETSSRSHRTTSTAAASKNTSTLTTATPTPATPTPTTATTPTKPKLDPWEWHEKLVSNEGKRSKLMEQRYQSKQIQYTAIQQLVTDAIQETSLAYRWTTSIIKIQDEFAHSLTLKELMVNDQTSSSDPTNSHHHHQIGGCQPYDIDDPETLYNQMVETVTLNDTLPEKVKRHNNNDANDDDDDEETENSLAGSFNVDQERNAIQEVAVIVTTDNTNHAPKRNSMLELLSGKTTSTTGMTTTNTPHATTSPNQSSFKNDTTTASASSSLLKHQPPVFAISFPNPFCSQDAYYILHKQHELLQQTLSRNGVNQSSMEKIQQMKELAQENENKLHELAGTILQDWKIKEDEIQKLWNNYLSIAMEVLSHIPKTTPMPEWPKSTDTVESNTKKMKYTTGDVWMAEILYRTAVKRQEINVTTEEITLQSLCEIIKDGEYQRRTRLRKHIQVDVLQKHASILDRVQLGHAEAIDSYVRSTIAASMTTTTTTTTIDDGFTDEYKYLDNDTFHSELNGTKKTKDDSKKKLTAGIDVPKKKLSIKEQIQEIATFIGTTTIWDAPSNNTSSNHTTTPDPIDTENLVGQTETEKLNPVVVDDGAVDVDQFVGSFDNDDEEEEGCDDDDEELNDLPLLKDAIIDPYTVAGSPGTSSSQRKKRRSGRSSSKKRKPKTKSMIGLRPVDEKYNIQNPVVLDQQSSKHAFFMDQLLFSGSLLESHYVQYASVVGLEDNYSSSYYDAGESKSSKKDDTSSSTTTLNKHGLVIVTSDDILHLFEIPSCPPISSNNSYLSGGGSSGTSNGSTARDEVVKIVPGCHPEDALLLLLKQNANADLIMKEQQDIQALLKEKLSPVPSSPSKLSSFLRPKSSITTTKEENKCFQFQNMVPSISMSLSECTVRQSLNGQSSVRISHNSVNPRIASNKLIFANTMDQNAFLQATRTDVTLWDLK